MNVELKDLVGGALQEQFSKAFDKVVENLQNPNTSYRNARKITIELKFTQNEARDDVKCALFVADGDAWQLEAMQNVKEYLDEQLKDCANLVVIC